jgi:hypothetical protein
LQVIKYSSFWQDRGLGFQNIVFGNFNTHNSL